MQGSPNADKIIGGDGDDLMIGAGGDDWMNGGDGHDTIFLEESFGKDTVINFERGHDLIDAREFFGVSSYAAAFEQLDQNDDQTINAFDSNVSWGKGRMTVNFDADGTNSLTLVGISELSEADFVLIA
jgi:Ca2+-binding RTX toxin-like protein